MQRSARALLALLVIVTICGWLETSRFLLQPLDDDSASGLSATAEAGDTLHRPADARGAAQAHITPTTVHFQPPPIPNWKLHGTSGRQLPVDADPHPENDSRVVSDSRRADPTSPESARQTINAANSEDNDPLELTPPEQPGQACTAGDQSRADATQHVEPVDQRKESHEQPAVDSGKTQRTTTIQQGPTTGGGQWNPSQDSVIQYPMTQSPYGPQPQSSSRGSARSEVTEASSPRATPGAPWTAASRSTVKQPAPAQTERSGSTGTFGQIVEPSAARPPDGYGDNLTEHSHPDQLPVEYPTTAFPDGPWLLEENQSTDAPNQLDAASGTPPRPQPQTISPQLTGSAGQSPTTQYPTTGFGGVPMLFQAQPDAGGDTSRQPPSSSGTQPLASAGSTPNGAAASIDTPSSLKRNKTDTMLEQAVPRDQQARRDQASSQGDQEFVMGRGRPEPRSTTAEIEGALRLANPYAAVRQRTWRVSAIRRAPNDDSTLTTGKREPLSDPLLPAEERPVATAGAMQPVTAQSERIIQTAFSLASRNAIYSARAEFIAALRMLTEALDALTGTAQHSRSLEAGLTALKEADDLVAGYTDASVDVARIVETHKTPVLKDAAADVSLLAARQQYYTYAQDKLAEACENNPAGSKALYGLGKLSSWQSTGSPDTLMVQGPKAVVFHRAALTVDPGNVSAANELGVLLAKYGALPHARDVLLHGISVNPTADLWHNLAAVHERLGEQPLATQARRQQQLAEQRLNQQMAHSPDDTLIRWVDADTFARMSRNPLQPAPKKADQQTPASPSRPAQPGDADKGGWKLPWQ